MFYNLQLQWIEKLGECFKFVEYNLQLGQFVEYNG